MIGFEILLTGGSALDAVQKVVEFLEADPTFNAGRGSVLNARGEVELDAAIMEGSELKAALVACVSGVLHPVVLAREVLEHSQHVMLAGDGARSSHASAAIPLCDPKELIVERERERFLAPGGIRLRLQSHRPGDGGRRRLRRPRASGRRKLDGRNFLEASGTNRGFARRRCRALRRRSQRGRDLHREREKRSSGW